MSYPKFLQFVILIISIVSIYSRRKPAFAHKSQDPSMIKYDKWFEDTRHPGPFTSTQIFTGIECNPSPELVDEVYALKKNVTKILKAVLEGEYRGVAYDNLTTYADKTSGSQATDNAMSFLDDWMMSMQLKNLHEEVAEIPVWSRGVEVAMIMDPFKMELTIRGFGMTTETSKRGLIAPVMVVNSFRELEEQRADVAGRIVVFNSDSGEEHKHIVFGPSKAGRYGAVAVLCKSPIELVYSPAIAYKADAPKIPSAVISREDADKLEVLVGRHDVLTVYLCLTDQIHATRNARNIFGDYVGTDLKDEFVMLTSHIGSWDQGEGVPHDTVGVVLEILTITLLQSLQLHPRRSIRLGVLSAEESGFVGTTKWVERHHDELYSYSSIVEADLGCLKATGIILSGNSEAACLMKEIMLLFEDKTGAKVLSKMEGVPDNPLRVHPSGVPMISVNGDGENGGYIETQHRHLESVKTVDPKDMDRCLATLASTVYVLAQLEDKLPRK